MEMSASEVAILKAVEELEERGEMFASLDEVVAHLAEDAVADDAKKLLAELRSLKKQGFIAFEVGRGVTLTESGSVALRAA